MIAPRSSGPIRARLTQAMRRKTNGANPQCCTANIHDRASIERAYPREAYASDASQNERRKPAMLHGVRIAAAPDDKGEFAIEPAVQHAGEMPGAVFLAPFHRVTAEENAEADPDPRLGYEAFLDEIIEMAERLGFRADASQIGRASCRE